jgi:membrane fusion protein (multidrug efflux system)
MRAPLLLQSVPSRRAALALLLATVGCGGAEEKAPSPARPVVVTAVEPVDLTEVIEASGELLAKHRAEVAAQVDGEITEVLADEGDSVADGQVVLSIDPERRQLERDRTRARVAEAEAAIAEQRREVKRMRILAGKQVASETQLDAAETGLRTAEARLAAAQAEAGVADRALRDASVAARFPGVIARRHVNRGEFVGPGQPLFELVSLDPIEVEFHLPEADASRVEKGIPIEVSVAPYPGEVFAATITVVSPIIDKRTRTLRVRAEIDNGDGRLRPGLFAHAHLGIAVRPGVLMVPEEAVLQRVDGSVVFRVVGDRVQRVLVEAGVIRDGAVEIRTGLAAGDRIVRRGHAELIDGSAVAARNPDGTPVATEAARVSVGGSGGSE